ncbi:hypothetical protein UA08_03914 [Talaromyces atroroseus]|uniref:MARVEL domain-containing protein n=1 Tax=Talaromyces atroroseus TaxID=1441469 RepID=A0A225AR22_TALAT|nr:hypothetical protein UA08_03914 [Talaromyces atroroseus]OKL60814.1 hypothetical protein UA08_03914 [Talaromyces atroroseus]
MSNHQQQQQPTSILRTASTASSSSSSSDLKSPRMARFAEATTVISPIDPSQDPARSPFADPPDAMSKEAQHHVSDVGFGYVNDSDPARHAYHPPLTPASPLKSALKTPGTARTLNPFSPTFREEVILEKEEKKTQRDNARDIKIKIRVRAAKIILRFVNFSCSLIVLSLLSTSLTIFRTTKSLPERSNLPPWAEGTNPWPQYMLLVMSCISLFTALMVFYYYWRGGFKRGEKASIYYSLFSVAFFTFSTIMWIVGAAIYEASKSNGGGEDMWGWSCNDNYRRQLFSEEVNYALVCRLQDWSLVCAIIEVVLEVIVIFIYGFVFYRIYSKRRLRRAMNLRDKARSDLYLAQLRVQSAPNTPGFFPMTPKSPYVSMAAAVNQDSYSAAENGQNYGVQYANPKPPTRVASQPFQLQAPPIRVQNATPQVAQQGFGATDAAPTSSASTTEEDLSHKVNEHVGAALGEQTFDAVPIPGAYAGTHPPQDHYEGYD